MKYSKKFDPFSEFFGDLNERFQGDRWQPAVDVFETEAAIVIRVEMAGVRKSDLHVTVDKNLLRISGLRKPKTELGVRRLHQMEIAFGPFERSIRIEIPFDTRGIEARLEDGFLYIVLPKLSNGPRRIEISASEE